MLFLRGSWALEDVPHVNILKLGVFLLGMVALIYMVHLAVQVSTYQGAQGDKSCCCGEMLEGWPTLPSATSGVYRLKMSLCIARTSWEGLC